MTSKALQHQLATVVEWNHHAGSYVRLLRMICRHLGISKADRHSLVGFCSISAVLRRNVRLYQLVAPSLAGRAALFGQQLDLPPAWRVLDLPYFAAPGLSSTSLLAAQEAAAPETGGVSVDGGLDHLRARVPGRMSSEVAPWQQKLSDRTLSSDPYMSTKQQQQQLQQRRARSAQEASLIAAVQQAAAGSEAPAAPATPSPTAALMGPGEGAGEGGVQAAAATVQPRSLSSTTPFLSASQQRLSSLEDEPAAGDTSDAIAAAAAAAAAGAQQQVANSGSNSSRHVSALQPQAGTAHSGLSYQQLMSPGIATLHSHSTQGAQSGQLTPYHQQQQQQRPGTPLSPHQAAAAAGNPSQSLLVLRAASLQLNVAPSALLASSNGDRRGAGGQRVRGSGLARALFPPVTILFATVEGSGELLRYPALARCVSRQVLALYTLHQAQQL
jgi:hypothetical protein